ncbi:hypothetical protein A9Q99_00100 [Gammaproteobacteria bacterium 45_16_T64]|nr:hypothetical protein A9Q99_00100 [Gammaproteobacteria bacterium 45_16_T64]
MTNREKWLAVIGYVLAIYDVFITQVLGIYHLVVVGYFINYFTLVPFLLFYALTKKSQSAFLKGHSKRSMFIYRWYMVGAFASGMLFRSPNLSLTVGVYSMTFLMIAIFGYVVVAGGRGINRVSNEEVIGVKPTTT